MALYANFVLNPSFELATTSWSAENTGTLARVGSNAFSGSYSMQVQKVGAQNVFGGAYSVVPITPGASQAHTLSLYISGATENHGATYNAGTKVTVYDLIPGQATTSRANQVATQTFARTTNGRVAIRNFVPRATADRIVIAIETASTYFHDNGYTVTGPFTSYFSSESSAQAFANSHYNSTLDYDYNGPGGTKRWIVRYYNRTKNADTSGGTSTVYADAIQLEQATTEAIYIDGTKAGYVWSGDPHNSATLNVVPLQASGSATLSGPDVIFFPVLLLQSGGTFALTGTAELLADGTVSASGSPMDLSDASIEIWQLGAAGSDGAMSMVGVLIMAAIVPFEADGEMGPGTGSDEPYAEGRLVWDAGGATGDVMFISGGIDITFPQPITASGGMIMDGTGRLEIGWQISSAGQLTLSGLAELSDAIPHGAFEDFVVYTVASDDSDPLMLGRGGGNAGSNSGANGAAWNRIWAEFYAPADQPVSGGAYAWRRAAYAGVGFQFASVPAANYQELNLVQLEASSTDAHPGPRTYKTAKTIAPLVWADRINYADNELWTFFGSSGISVTEGDASPIEHDPNPIRELNFSSTTTTGFFGGNIITPPLGMWCVASVYLKGDGNIPAMRMRILGAGLNAIASTEYIPLPAGQWVRLELPFQPSVADHILALDPPEDILSAPALVQAAGVMVEHGMTAGTYLGFVAGTTDYFYRYNGVDTTKGVFLYNNIGERIPLLTYALRSHAPLAIRVAEPEFGLLPNLD